MKKLISLVVVILVAVGCKTSSRQVSTLDTAQEYKRIVNQLQREIDSLYIATHNIDTVYTIKTLAAPQSFEIENPCDSLTGELRKINLKVGKSTVTTQGNTLYINTECEASLKTYKGRVRDITRYSMHLERQQDSLQELHNSTLAAYHSLEEKTKTFWAWPSFFTGALCFGLIWWFVLRKLF